MGRINSLISEVFANLKDPIKPTDHKFLQIELGCDSEVEVGFKVVVVSNERSGSCSTWNHVHLGGFNLQKASLFHEIPNMLDDFIPEDKSLS